MAPNLSPDYQVYVQVLYVSFLSVQSRFPSLSSSCSFLSAPPPLFYFPCARLFFRTRAYCCTTLTRNIRTVGIETSNPNRPYILGRSVTPFLLRSLVDLTFFFLFFDVFHFISFSLFQFVFLFGLAFRLRSCGPIGVGCQSCKDFSFFPV